ncbi:TetR/AcrR family transcriptional regulator [Roseinatronobacter bogoriensis]|uniref:TetR/AcrR family transcriptional regulator n=1 Tax=Roseinatronobacter bogoriensis subsp. barguzinensis TaxID=441209 RepID=A0A2K8K679_9RHOB|nr:MULTISPECIES: TetR/AcrR family transcriptional regulator [Rhodobaca]ATX64436.1 TetR/AcrR family transcriptional regulator [Rhodobaca barguzinensis]MBB4209139.1 AcrR family transcriptional regulator [Rhodobaca bogoriensis DSM 18756]TDW36333.1 TetR family transcriptional regulator [Rhodobaca barguzinensis]TDY67539.1 TetR family transcriptional regulator [Rhodobaca bogoriensis DSM 18756]
MARSRAHDFEVKQRSILRSAAAVFAEVGMDKASMSQIAARADVSKALLYHYYPGRDALIFDILRTNLTELDEAIAAADQPDAPPKRRLRALVHAVLEQYRDSDDYHNVQLNGTQTLPQEQRDEIMAIERRIVRRFATVIREVNPDLEAERPILMPVTMSIFGMMNWVYTWFKEGGPVSRADYADLATDILLGGIEKLR